MARTKCVSGREYARLKSENKALKETCEILADKRAIREIRESLRQIRGGKGVLLSSL